MASFIYWTQSLPQQFGNNSPQYYNINEMALQNCQAHNQPANVICHQAGEVTLLCPQCFSDSQNQLGVGVVLNQAARDGLVQWNKALSDKFKQVLDNLKVKGSNSILEMKLSRNHPKGLINQLSNTEIVEVTIKVIEEYLQNLTTNIDFVVNSQSIDELNIPQLLKDIYVFFVYDTNKGLTFLAERIKAELIQKFSNKSIYEYLDFVLVSKQLRSLQMKRKSLTNRIKESVVLNAKRSGEVLSPLPLRTKKTSSQKESSKSSNTPNSQRVPQIKKEEPSPQRVLSPPSKDLALNADSPNLDRKQRKFISPPQTSPQLQAELAQKAQREETDNKEISPKTRSSRLLQRSNPQVFNAEPLKLQASLQPQKREAENEQLQKLRAQISSLQKQLQDKNRSIKSLNSLIGNQEQEIASRENQVQTLSQEIRKLLEQKKNTEQIQKQLQLTKAELNLKQRSITELNKLIGNEEQELQYRQSQVDTLTREITKLVQWKERCEETESRLREKQKQLDLREKGIKELNNVISNQQEELAFRESEVEMLTKEVKKAQQARAELQSRLDQAQKQIQALRSHGKQQPHNSQAGNQNFDDQLMEQVIELESGIVARDQDIKRLVSIFNSIRKYIPTEHLPEVVSQLSGLKTVSPK